MKNILKSFYRKYNKNYQAEFLNKKEFNYFKNCKKILDIGCGSGEFLLLDPKKIIGVDQNKKSITLCKEKKLQALVGDVTKLPFPDDLFDGVHCAHVIEHLFPKEAYSMLKEAGRVLKKRGIFLLSTPILWDGFYNDFTHLKPYNPTSIRRYLSQNGEQKTMDDFSYSFREIGFYWRYQSLPLGGKIGYLTANYIYQFGASSFKKDGYTIIFQKI